MIDKNRLTAYPQTSAEKEAQLEELIRQDPGNSHAKKTLAFTYYTNQKYEKAIRLYSQLSQQDGKDPAVHFYMGNTLYRLKSFQEAIQSWERAIEMDTTGIYKERAQQRIDMAQSMDLK